MPRIIREAFMERIRRSSVLAELLRDVSEVAGLKIHFYGSSGETGFAPPCYEHSALCRRLNQQRSGAALCESARMHLLEEASGRTVTRSCVAGTAVCAVPIPSSAGLLGYLVAGGFYGSKPTLPDENRVRHLLERNGFALSPGEIARLCERTTVVSPPRQASLRRLLEIAAGYLVKELSLELFQQGGDLPESIQRACHLIQKRFKEDPSQETVARAVGLSSSHFSRLFHARTGLRYKEYVNEVRLQYVRRELRERDTPVTQVALDAGYHTLSQFNRQFKAHYGVAPREYRKRYRAG